MSNLLTISYGETESSAELMEAALKIMVEAGSVLEIETVQIGNEMVRLGFEKGFDKDVLRKINCSRLLLKAPDEMPNLTADLCEALEIGHEKEIYGEGEYAAQGFINNEYAIFEPCTRNVRSMLNAALMALYYVRQDIVAQRIETALAGVDSENSPNEFAEEVINRLNSSAQ